MSIKCFQDEHGVRWWKNRSGLLHRVNGPAIEWPNGAKEWYQFGQLHREDGPAIRIFSGSGELYLIFYLRGRKYSSKEEWFLNLPKASKLNMIWKLDEL